MSRPSQETKVKAAIAADLAAAETVSPEVLPLSETAIATRIGVSPPPRFENISFLTTWNARESGRHAMWIPRLLKTRKTYDTRLATRDGDIVRLNGVVTNLVARMAVIEGNAQRLNVDPAELYRPLEAPPGDAPGYGA